MYKIEMTNRFKQSVKKARKRRLEYKNIERCN